MRTQLQELVVRVKAWLWSNGWVALTYFVDLLLQSIGTASLPTFTIDLTTIGIALVVPVNTAIIFGLVLNQVSKYLHNERAGKVR